MENDRHVQNADPLSDLLVCVDRTSKPSYPDVETEIEIMHPELECTGPFQYYLSQIYPWVHPSQKFTTLGKVIYRDLVAEDILDSFLNLQDGLAISRMRIEIFRIIFGRRKSIFLWKSVIRTRFGHLEAPYLGEVNGEIKIGWHALDRRWDIHDPALRFFS